MQLPLAFLPIDLAYYGANLFLMAAVLLGFKQWMRPPVSDSFFWGTLLLKFAVTLILSYVFVFHFDYVTDVELLFFESTKTQTLWLDYPTRGYEIYFLNQVPEVYNHHFFSLDLPRAFFMIKVVSLLNFVTNTSYWLDALWFSLFSYLSAWTLCMGIHARFPSFFRPATWSFLLVPTTVFWTSGLLKECLAAGLLYLLAALYVDIVWRRNSILHVVWGIVPAYLLFQVKFYVLGAFILTTFPSFVVEKVLSLNPATKVVAYILVMAATLAMANYVCIQYFTVGIAELIFYNHKMMGETGNVQYYFDELGPSAWSFVQYVPNALWQGLFMPLPIGLTSKWLALEAAFNLLTLVGMFYCLVGWIRKPVHIQGTSAIVLVYVLVCALALGFSAPNFGTLARYKVVYVPFLHLLLFHYLAKEKWVGYIYSCLGNFAYFSIPKKNP